MIVHLDSKFLFAGSSNFMSFNFILRFGQSILKIWRWSLKKQNRREFITCMLMQYCSVNHKWRRTAWESLCVEFIRLGLSLGRQETQRIALYGSQVILQRQVFSRVLALTVLLGRVNLSSSVDSRCFSKFSALAAEQRSLQKKKIRRLINESKEL